MKSPCQRSGPRPPGVGGLVDHPERHPVGDVPDDHAADRQDPPLGEVLGDEDHRDAQEQTDDEAEVLDQPQLLLADIEEYPVGELGPRLDVLDDHELDVEHLVDVLADLLGDGGDELGQLGPHPLVDRLADHLGEAVPQLRPLPLHDPLDQGSDLRLGTADDLHGELLRLELAVELRRRAHLGDAGVDGDAPHLRRPRRDDPLPAEAAVHQPGDLLEPAWQHADQRLHPADTPAAEVDRVEEHDHPAPVGDVADHPCEERDGQIPEQLVAHGEKRPRTPGPVAIIEQSGEGLHRARSPCAPTSARASPWRSPPG